MYYYYYENTGYESKTFATYEEAENAYPEIEIEVASTYGYCDPDYLFMAEADEE